MGYLNSFTGKCKDNLTIRRARKEKSQVAFIPTGKQERNTTPRLDFEEPGSNKNLGGTSIAIAHFSLTGLSISCYVTTEKEFRSIVKMEYLSMSYLVLQVTTCDCTCTSRIADIRAPNSNCYALPLSQIKPFGRICHDVSKVYVDLNAR